MKNIESRTRGWLELEVGGGEESEVTVQRIVALMLIELVAT